MSNQSKRSKAAILTANAERERRGASTLWPGALVGSTLLLGLAVACTGGTPVPDAPRPPSVAEAFGESGGVTCSAVRPQTEPDLMGWDPGSRANLNQLSDRGIVAVRYRSEGCNVELELLPNCIGEGSYKYSAYPSSESRVAKSAQDLYTQLPLGAARLSGKVGGNRALRTDYTLVGMESLPPGVVFEASQLKGPGCERATHVVSRIYLGGFGMMAGEARTIEAAGSVFGFEAGGTQVASGERLAREGNPAQCKKAEETGEPQPLCSVPLRIGLLPVEGAGQGSCPEGTRWDGEGQRCVQTQVTCPAGTRWEGGQCAATVSTACPAGLHFEGGKGCVPDAAHQVPDIPPPPRRGSASESDKSRDEADPVPPPSIFDIPPPPRPRKDGGRQ